MLFMSLDLEMNQPSGKIIQIGACICSFNTGLIVDELRIFVNPNEELNPQISTLTGITDQQLKRGVSLFEAYEKLANLLQKYQCFPSPLIWGGNDNLVLKTELDKANVSYTWIFGHEAIDVKAIYFAHTIKSGTPFYSGLEKIMKKLNLEFDGRSHDALYDAKNTFLLAYYLITGQR